MKKLQAIALALILVLPIGGCGTAKKTSKDFAAYTKTIPPILMENTSFDINFLFDHPQKYGIKKKLYTLDYISLIDFRKEANEFKKKLKELDSFDYASLTKDQKITYDLLKEQTKNNHTKVDDLYYLTTNYFDTSAGIQAQLPMSLWVYEFKSKKSLDSYLAVLNEAPTMFKKYVDLEKTRQDKGYGMSKTYMDDVMKSFHTINTTDQSYILDSAIEKIKALDFITPQEKDSYINKITDAFQNKLLPAFAQTEKDLASITIKKKGEGALASYKGGKQYYEDYVCEASDTKSIDDYTSYLEKERTKIQQRILPLLKKYPDVRALFTSGDTQELEKKMQDVHYTDLTTSAAVIQHLEQIIQNSKDFPKIKKLDYKMESFPASMKDTTIVAAAYFLSAFDDTSGKDEQMILNGTFAQSDFTTIAHESFPGHMYQHNYFKSVPHDLLRDLLANDTYAEGWATYTEDVACDYTLQPGICHFNNINNQLTYTYVLELDKKIHYDGISRQSAYTFMKENFGISDETVLKQQYEQLLENPAVFSDYYGGYFRIMDLQDAAKKKWKDKYSAYRFHKAILDAGPLPMDLLKKYMGL